MQLSFDQIRRVFENYLAGQKITAHAKQARRCPFHDDRSASMTVFISGNGGYNCHGCGAHGNLFQFVAELENITAREAEGKVSALTGAKSSFSSSDLGAPVALYDYRDANGRLAFQKRRYAPEGRKKDFRQFRWSDEEERWVSNLAGVERILYQLPQVITANVVIVTEGEKDADRLTSLRLYREHGDRRVVSTCSFDGAWGPGQTPKWLASYNPYFAGKMVIILADNDANGETYATHAAAAVSPFAFQVKIVLLPNLPEHGDVSDWLDGGHSREELENEINKAPAWHAAEKQSHVLVSAPEFVSAMPEELEYLVNGVVPKGGNGFFVAVTKGRKSWSAVDMLISMALGEPWLGFSVPRPVRCALVSREDSPSLTAWRMGHLFRGKRAKHPELLETNLFVNSRAQTPQFMLDNPAQVSEMIAEFKKRKIEFAIFDVFNVMHSVDENDNTQMRTILQALSSFQIETGCSIGVVHHFGKMETASLVHRMRGASAIAGWAEWLVGLTLEDEDAGIVKVEFKSKASAQTPSVYFEIESGNGVARLQPVAQPESRKQAGRRPLNTIAVQERERRDLQ